MPIRFKLLLAATALASIATVTEAQDEPAPLTSADIIVIGVTPAEIDKAALAITAPGNLYHEALPKFQNPVCPGVIGAPIDFAAQAVARMRATVQRLKLRVGKDGCKANLVVLFLPSGQAAMQNLLHDQPSLFGDIPKAKLKDLRKDPVLKELAADPGPVHAWVNIESRSRDGAQTTGLGNAVEPSVMKAPGASSRIFMAARRDIVSSLIVIDIDASAGMSAEQIGDYAAMRGLARTRPPAEPGGVDTILSLFAESDPPPEMTSFDQAYLRAAYSSAPNISAMHNVARVAREREQGE